MIELQRIEQDIEVDPSEGCSGKLLVQQGGVNVADWSGYQGQLQVRSAADNSLVGIGTVDLSEPPYVKWDLPGTLATDMAYGASSLYRLKLRKTDLSWGENGKTLQLGAAKKLGKVSPWS